MCAWGFLQRPVITDPLKVNCHLKLHTGVDNSTDPLVFLLVVLLKNNKLWHCHPNCKPWKNPQGYSWNSVLIHFEWRPADRSLGNAYQVWQNSAASFPDNSGHHCGGANLYTAELVDYLLFCPTSSQKHRYSVYIDLILFTAVITSKLLHCKSETKVYSD